MENAFGFIAVVYLQDDTYILCIINIKDWDKRDNENVNCEYAKPCQLIGISYPQLVIDIVNKKVYIVSRFRWCCMPVQCRYTTLPKDSV